MKNAGSYQVLVIISALKSQIVAKVDKWQRKLEQCLLPTTTIKHNTRSDFINEKLQVPLTINHCLSSVQKMELHNVPKST